MHDLSIERDEIIVIGDHIEVSLVDILGDRVRLGINAPRDVSVHRKEVSDFLIRSELDLALFSAQSRAITPSRRSSALAFADVGTEQQSVP